MSNSASAASQGSGPQRVPSSKSEGGGSGNTSSLDQLIQQAPGRVERTLKPIVSSLSHTRFDLQSKEFSIKDTVTFYTNKIVSSLGISKEDSEGISKIGNALKNYITEEPEPTLADSRSGSVDSSGGFGLGGVLNSGDLSEEKVQKKEPKDINSSEFKRREDFFKAFGLEYKF